MYVVLIGPPGCGKGTQSQRLNAALGIPHLSTGEMLREAMRERTPVGQRVEALLQKGMLASDEVIMDLVEERLRQEDCHRGCLFDGVPRTLCQAETLDRLLEGRGCQVDRAIEIDVNDAELSRRILLRGQIENRLDDTPETLKRRLQVYHTETTPILEHYRQRGRLRTVDGTGTPEEVFQRMIVQLNGLLPK